MRNRTVVENFIEENKCLFGHFEYVKGLYIRQNMEELIVLECTRHNGKCKTFVISFQCGNMVEISTEFNTFNNYLNLVAESDHAEYVTRFQPT